MKAGLDGQDVVVAVALAVPAESASFLDALLSAQGRAASLKRLRACGLISPEKTLNRLAFREFLGGARYVFPGDLGETLVFGVPTSLSGPALRESFVINAKAEVVWEYRAGLVQGRALEPLHADLPRVAPAYPSIYALLSLVDAIRAGRSRERTLALQRLQEDL